MGNSPLPAKRRIAYGRVRAATLMDRPIWFPRWKDALAQTLLPEPTKAAYTRGIVSFIKHGKECHAAATTERAKR